MLSACMFFARPFERVDLAAESRIGFLSIAPGGFEGGG
jgi:hypothetical protein